MKNINELEVYQLIKQRDKWKSRLVISVVCMELDSITKWLIRISSSIIIALGLILIIGIPLLALKISSIIYLIQEIIQGDLKDILSGLINKI